MARPRVLYLVSEDWYFLLHRLTTARAALAAGYEVHVATQVQRHGAAIEEQGFHLHPIGWRRGVLSPLRVWRSVREVRALYRRLSPDLVHHVALEGIVIGALAASGLGIATVNGLVGLGYAFTSDTPKARTVRAVLTRLLPHLLDRPRSALVVENPDDRAFMVALGMPPERTRIIAGSAIDIDNAVPMPEPDGPITVAFVGRMLGDKGLRTLMEAHRLLAARGRPLRLQLAGEPDAANPSSIPEAELRGWASEPNIEWLGWVDDIEAIWKRAHVAVLPSRREGLPQALLEAAAYGRPIIATDVPGCREIARDGVTALLVPRDDPHALAAALERIVGDADLRRRLGAAGRALVEREFSSALVGRAMIELYQSLLAERP